MKSFRQDTEALRNQLVTWRRDFHRHPELAFEVVRTSGIVADVLRNLGLEVQTGIGRTGVVGLLEGDVDGPTVLVRADMDALPILEENEVEYVSREPGKMHACGHDGHTAIALGVATMLAQQRTEIQGRVKFVFQPAEEVIGGAQAMIDDGVLTNPKPDIALGLHLWNSLPIGQVAVTDGPFMASAGKFQIVVHGQGAHAAQPHLAHDPIVAAAQIITGGQTIVSRNVNPLDTAVLSFTMVHGGDAFNVIPAGVEMSGTIRTFRTATFEKIADRLQKLADQIAGAMNCTAEFALSDITPPVVNDAAIAARLRDVFGKVDNVEIIDDLQTMTAEDVALFLKAVPGVFFFVGSANAEAGLDFPHHHSRFDIDESALVVGANLLASAVGEYVLPKSS